MLPALNGGRHERLHAKVPGPVLLRDTRDVVELTRVRDLRLGRQLDVLVPRLLLLLPLLPARQTEGDVLRVAGQAFDAVPHLPGRGV